jgi:hypothetical protein
MSDWGIDASVLVGDGIAQELLQSDALIIAAGGS